MSALVLSERRHAGRRTGWLAAALLAALLTLQSAPGARAAEPLTPVTYEGPTYPTASGSPTQDKPQSKLWFNDGSWWAVMRTANGMTVHRLGADHRWTDTGTVVDERLSSTQDVLWEAGKLVVASRAGSGGVRVARLSYDGSTDRYAIELTKQVATGSTESVTIARDSQNRLWVAYTQGKPRRVLVAHSTVDHSTWTAPFGLPVTDNTVANDDIAAVAAFSGRIGVMWSDQSDEVVRFAFHRDGDPDDTWTLETAASGPNMADDHINLKSLLEDDQGRLFAAVKTSRGDDGEPDTDPLIMVLRRDADGTWSSVEVSTVGEGLTRPQLVVDSTNDRVFVFMATEAGGTIYYKSAPLDTLGFPPTAPEPFVQWPGAQLNNPTTTKQAVTAATGLVVLASHNGNQRYYHAELPLGAPGEPDDETPPSVPDPVSAAATSPTSAELSWPASTDDVGVTGYLVTRDVGAAVPVTGTTFSDTGLTAETTYTYTVSAVDAAGNRSAESAPVTVTTPPADEPPPSSGPVTFVSAASVNGTGNTITAPGPAGVEDGDLLLAAVSVRGDPIIEPPAGWTQVRNDAGSGMRQAVYAHVADGSTTSSTWTLDQAQPAVVQVLAYRGVDTADPVMSSACPSSRGTSLVSPAVTTVDGSAVVTVAGIARNATLTPEPALTERSEDASTSTNKKVSANAADLLASGTAAGPFTAVADGSASGIAQTVALRPGADDGGAADTTLPTVPGTVTATATSPTSVDVTWDASTDDTGVTEYKIFRDDVQIGTSTTTSYPDTGLTAETTYSYTVTAVDASGNTSAPSAAGSATTPAGAVDPAGPITFVAAATAEAAGESISGPVPAGLQPGDVLVATVSARGVPEITAPEGWTLIRFDANGSAMRQAMYVSVATGTDTPWTWTLSRNVTSVVQVLAYRGVDAADPVVSAAGQFTEGATLTSPAVTTVDGAAVLTFAGIARQATLDPSAPLAERSELTASVGTARITANSGEVVVAGTTAGPYETLANREASGIAQTLALRPAL